MCLANGAVNLRLSVQGSFGVEERGSPGLRETAKALGLPDPDDDDATDHEIEEQDNPLMIVPNANTLQEVVDTLNALGATPRDLIIILQSMSQSGRLLAEVRSI